MCVLRDERDIAAPHLLVGRTTEDDDLSGVGYIETRKQMEQRRLAGAGAADDRDDFARLDVERHVVENALRVTPAGGTVRIVAREGTLAVEDDGPGLRPDEVPHAFERFYLYSRYAGSRAVGTGLGLAIVDELARAMGGAVEVRSARGRTCFSIRLPAARGARRVVQRAV